MGFPQLLAANRSLRNIRNGPSRYKMTQGNLLPRFGAEAGPGAAGRSAIPLAGVPASRVATARGARPQQVGLVTSPAPAPSFQPRVAQPAVVPWWRRLVNPFGRAGAGAGPGPVQAEFVLESVEPVRNLLVESDLAVSSVPGPTGSEPLPGPAGAVAQPGLWRRWAGQIFGRDGGDRA